MKTLLLATMILTSTFAFSETREEREDLLNARLKTNQAGQFFTATAALPSAILMFGAVKTKINPEKYESKAERIKAANTMKRVTRLSKIAGAAGLLWVGTEYNQFEVSNKGIYKELAEIEDATRNDRDKSTETLQKETDRDISAIDMN